MRSTRGSGCVQGYVSVFGIERSDQRLDVVKLEQPRFPRDEQPDAPLHRRDVRRQAEIVNDTQQIDVAVDRRPRRERDESRHQRHARRRGTTAPPR